MPVVPLIVKAGKITMEIIFGIIMLVGLAYLLLMIAGGGGESLDLGMDGVLESSPLGGLFGLESPDAGEAGGLGCGVIAAFLAGFGAVGLTGTLAGWNALVILGAALAFGLVLGRLVIGLLRFVIAQQGTRVFSSDDLIGLSGRVTIDSPAGKTGEVILEGEQVLKYPVKEVNDAPLKRGDIVEVVDIDGRFLRVKKKRTGS